MLSDCIYQVGGGYEEHDLSDITLTWMAVCFLTLSNDAPIT